MKKKESGGNRGSLLDASLRKTADRVKDSNPCFRYDPNVEKVRMGSGSFILDFIADGGFLVKGCLVELLGVESSGKSTLCMHSAKQAVDAGWVGVYIDFEGTYDHHYAESIGLVQGDTYQVVQPITAEEGEWTVVDLVDTVGSNLDFIIFDSIAACRPSALLTKSPDDPIRVGLHAAYWSQWIDRLSKIAMRYKWALLFTNQIRSKIVNPKNQYSILNTGIAAGYSYMDSGVTSTGGIAIRHYMGARYVLAQSGQVKEKGFEDENAETSFSDKAEDDRVAHWCFCKNVKNKMGVPFKKCKFVVRYGVGIDDLLPLFELLKKRGYLKMSGPWVTLSFNGREEKFKGKKACLEFLKTVKDQVISFVLADTKGKDALDVNLNEENADNYIDIEKIMRISDLEGEEEEDTEKS